MPLTSVAHGEGEALMVCYKPYLALVGHYFGLGPDLVWPMGKARRGWCAQRCWAQRRRGCCARTCRRSSCQRASRSARCRCLGLAKGFQSGYGLMPSKVPVLALSGAYAGLNCSANACSMTMLPRIRHAFGCALGFGSAAIIQSKCAAWPSRACRLARTLVRVWRCYLVRASSASAIETDES